jgi:hypothetical protein
MAVFQNIAQSVGIFHRFVAMNCLAERAVQTMWADDISTRLQRCIVYATADQSFRWLGTLWIPGIRFPAGTGAFLCTCRI